MASFKKIKIHNTEKFCNDIKKVRRVMVWASNTKQFFETTKLQVLKDAENNKIHYYLTLDIFEVKQLVMVLT